MKKITRTMKVSAFEYLYVDEPTGEIKNGFVKLIEAPEDTKKILKLINTIVPDEAIHIKNVVHSIQKCEMDIADFYNMANKTVIDEDDNGIFEA